MKFKFLLILLLIINSLGNGVNSQPTVYPPRCDTLLWSKVLNAIHYRMQITHNFLTNDIDSSNILDTFYVANQGLPPGMVYYMRVKAYRPADSTDWSSYYSFVFLIPAQRPTFLGVCDTNNITTFYWSRPSNAEYYRLQISTDSVFSLLVFNHGNIADTFYTMTWDNSFPSTHYYARVNASNCSGTSNWSNIYSFIISHSVGINKIADSQPGHFNLYQNYPNPFNPTTKIKFDIPALRIIKGAGGMNTKLIVNDILGREIAILVNEKLSPGIYEVEWNASDYPSGVYFYKLETGNFSQTKKLILIK